MFHVARSRGGWHGAVAGTLLLALAVVGAQVRNGVLPAGSPAPRPGPAAPSGGSYSAAAPAAAGQGLVSTGNGIVVGQSYHNDTSPALRDIPAKVWQPGTRQAENENPPIRVPGQKDAADPVVQRTFGALAASPAIPPPLNTFDGMGIPGVACNCVPPDTNGAVGPNHFVQSVNIAYQIWNKSGVSLYGPVSINTIWTGFGGACEIRNDGDPVVLYDRQADRWLVSQFTRVSPYNECVAVSATGDPTGAYHRYAFQLSTTDLPDYPHLGTWSDGYYMSVNWYVGGQLYGGPRPYAFDRTKMLAGLPATFQSTSDALGAVGPIMPADLSGPTAPPAGAPNPFVGFGSPMPFYQFHVDWTTPANSTWQNTTNLAVAAFTQLCPTARSCVPQPGGLDDLDSLADRPMFRLDYRNFGDHEAMVINYTVDAGGSQAAVRWYEIRGVSTTPSIFQQGTYAPDATSRWMGSAALDKNGDIAIGYSASSSSVYPSLRYAGRLSSDPLGTLGQGEATLYDGLGVQHLNRWGDYSSLTVDPVDDCTYWYTSEYYPAGSASINWRTRIGSFKFASCTSAPPTATASPVPPTATAGPPTNTPGPATATPTFTPVPPQANFTLTVTPASTTVAQGSSTTYTVSLASVNNFTGNVSLRVSGLPGRTTGTFSPNPVNLAGSAGASTLTVTVNRRATAGTYTLTVTGTSGTLTHSRQITLIVR